MELIEYVQKVVFEKFGVKLEMEVRILKDQVMEAVIITGMSGAGKTLALNYFEDMGYYCMEKSPSKILLQILLN